jgi:hypothetical protein
MGTETDYQAAEVMLSNNRVPQAEEVMTAADFHRIRQFLLLAEKTRLLRLPLPNLAILMQRKKLLSLNGLLRGCAAIKRVSEANWTSGLCVLLMLQTLIKLQETFWLSFAMPSNLELLSMEEKHFK